MTTWSLDALLAQADSIPAVSGLVPSMLACLRDEEASTDQLTASLSHDPILVARLLRAANSSAYPTSGPIDSVQKSIMLLGVRRVRGIALTVAILGVMEHAPPPFDIHVLRRHSLSAAVCARSVAHRVGADADHAFTAGLLHDIGQLLIATLLPAPYAELLGRCARERRHILHAERELLGTDHAEVGGELARRWGLPGEIVAAVAGHHDPSADHLALTVHLAEVVSHALDLDESPHNLVPHLMDGVARRLNLDFHEIARHFGEIEARFLGNRLALGI